MIDRQGKCQCETEVYTRVVGFFRPIKNFNKGKAKEYEERTDFNIKGSSNPRVNYQVNVEDDQLTEVTKL